VLWLASLTDRADAEAEALRRIGIAVTKYYVCKRAPIHAAESLECLGGNGYIEDSRMPRLYREAPLMSIWEGSGNVTALDTLRAAAKQPETVAALMAELDTVRGADERYDAFLDKLGTAFADAETLELRARRIVGDLALALQASQLLRHGHPAVTEAFVASRLDGQHGDVFGTLPAGLDLAPIIERATLKGTGESEEFIA
jgi:putative acyl-CoA dehydrogenase